MPELQYARGRIAESLTFISEEMQEFQEDYAQRTWLEYQHDKKLQKLIDRTLENILTALIEICGAVLAEEGISSESYGGALKRCSGLFGFSVKEQDNLASLAMQRNRLAHRYLNFKWQAIRMFSQQEELVRRLLTRILEREEQKSGETQSP